MGMQIKIVGLERILAKLGPQLLATPLRKFLTRAGTTFETEAKKGAPFAMGHLRASITTQVDSGVPPLWARTGPNVTYGPYMEFGTGTQTDGEGGRGGPHWPPSAALEVWARRHGFASGAQVARIIGRRGGLKPRRYMRQALKSGLGRVRTLVTQLGADIKAVWNG